jgi:hypothetical protein
LLPPAETGFKAGSAACPPPEGRGFIGGQGVIGRGHHLVLPTDISQYPIR